jgi:hypothetical protein
MDAARIVELERNIDLLALAAIAAGMADLLARQNIGGRST